MTGLCLLTACNPSSNQQTEKSVTQTVNTDSIQVLHGQLIMGHRSLQASLPDTDTTAYWVVDKSGELKKRYETGSSFRCKTLYSHTSQTESPYPGPFFRGFCSEYAGVMEVMGIEEVGE